MFYCICYSIHFFKYVSLYYINFLSSSSTDIVINIGLLFGVQIFNRHESLGLQVDNAILLVNLDGRYLGEAGLNIPYVAPNTAVVVPVELKVKLDFSELAGIASEEFLSFFSGEKAAWRDKIQARLTVQLPLGLQLPIYITEGYRHEFKEQ